jgi:hypothetical protein
MGAVSTADQDYLYRYREPPAVLDGPLVRAHISAVIAMCCLLGTDVVGESIFLMIIAAQ